ncbi:50S ribosomal protein L24 [SAR202 cluster bacterium AC-409-J13_OGT_754m]|nr:50S ribosomal protein L24 [SAR202 cluster bacterium AC-409-J13_OGT_754m]
MKIRKGDTVSVLKGKDRGKQGRVERVIKSSNRVLVEGVNMITRHVKTNPGVRQGGRIQQEAAIHVSNVMIICSNCNTNSRVGLKTLEDGSKVRICRKCKEIIN